MRNFEKTKKLLSFLLAAVMVLSYVPVRALAEEECPHHTCGTDCSFVEAVAGVACSHKCSDACTEEVTNCVHEHSEEEGCVFTPAAEKVDCDHDCANGDCGYVAAQEAVLCTCGAVPAHTAACAAVATEGAACDCGMPVTHTEECAPKEAVTGVPCHHVHGQCAYKEAVEESWACTHVCSKDNGCITEKCTHVCPADDCGFVEAVEGVPCDYVCQLCAEQNKTVCTADENCEAEEHAENCPMAMCADCEQLNKDCICCEHCDGIGEAHGEKCPKAVCPHCGNLNEAHSETCSTRCTNAEGCIDDKHGKDCPLYLCEVCGEKPCVCDQSKKTSNSANPYGLYADKEGTTPLSSISGTVGGDGEVYLVWDPAQNVAPEEISMKIASPNGMQDYNSGGELESVPVEGYIRFGFAIPDAENLYFYLKISETETVELSLEIEASSVDDNVNPAHSFVFYADAEGKTPVSSVSGAVGAYQEVYLMWDPQKNAAPASIRADVFVPGNVQAYTAFETTNQSDGCIKVKLQIPEAQSVSFSLTEPGSEQSWQLGLQVNIIPGESGQEKMLDSISVTTVPDKTAYACGEELDVTGGKLTLTYSDNSTEEVELTADMISGYSSTTVGEQMITVTYEGKTATFTVTVEKQQLPLFLNGNAEGTWRADQGVPTAAFTTDAAGSDKVPVLQLKTEGKATFDSTDEESNTVWLVFTGAGAGAVIYETDTAVYTFRVTVTAQDAVDTGDITHNCDITTPHLFYYNTEHGSSSHELSLTPGENYRCTVGFCDANGQAVLLTHTDVELPSFIASMYEGTNLGATGIGEGNITYTVGETTYTLPISSQLPDYGVYSAPQRTAENYMAKIPANSGEDRTVYLLWSENTTAAKSVEVVVDNTVYSDFQFTEKTENNTSYLEITFKVPGVNWIGFRVKDENGTQLKYFEIERTRPSSGGGQNTSSVKLEINGTPVTVGLAAVMGPENDLMILGGGIKGSYDPNHPDMGLEARLCIGAIVNHGDKDNEAVANQGVFNEILKTATITIVKRENHDGSDGSVPNIQITDPQEETVSGVKTKIVYISAEPKKLGMAQLELKFTYGGKEYKTYSTVAYENPDMSVNVSENANLAEVLSSSKNLIQWLQANYPNELAAYGGDGFVNINLPAKVYDYPIEVNIDEPAFSRIRLRGCTDETGRTVMRSLTVKRGIFTIDDIDFVAGTSGTQVALTHDNDNSSYHSRIGTVSGCTFQGYPVGVKDIGYGHIRYISESLFYNCDTAVIIYPETTGAGDNGGTIEYHGNTFMNTDVAISLEALPAGISAYRTQFNDNTFLFCDLEFNMVPTGTFYFMRNYYGGKERGNEKYEDWKHPGNKKDEQIRHHARIQEADKSGTKTVTNPVRKTIETPCEFWIYTGENQHTAIFNAESARMLIDGATFEDPVAAASDDSATDKEIPVSILDQNGNELALWTF